MYNVRKTRIPARRVRLCDYVPHGGSVVEIREHHTGGLFPKHYTTLTFYTGEAYVEYTVESHIPVDVERTYEQITHTVKEKK